MSKSDFDRPYEPIKGKRDQENILGDGTEDCPQTLVSSPLRLIKRLTRSMLPPQNERFNSNKGKFFACLFTLGLINNNGYVMVAAGADALSKDFDKEKLMPLFQL